MRKPKKVTPGPAPSRSPGDFPEASSPDFQFALEKLTAAYQPVIEDELNQLKSPPAPGATATAPSRTGEEDIQFANRIFESFMTEEVATRLLPQTARESLGPVENWRWCLEHVRCSLIFGWLACRGPRTFQSLSYYLYEYWKCIRAVSGSPVSKPPTAAEQADFQVVVGAFATAYKPYLTDQLATVEFPSAISGDVISGEYNAATGQDELCQIFDRMLSTETTRRLRSIQRFRLLWVLPLLGDVRDVPRLLFGAGAERRRYPAVPDLLRSVPRGLSASTDVRTDRAYGLRNGNRVRERRHFPRCRDRGHSGGIGLRLLHAPMETERHRSVAD